MRTKFLVLLGAFFIFALTISACNLPSSRSATPTAGEGEPGVSVLPTGTSVSRAPSNTDGAETILVPGGTFWMGSDKSDVQAEADEMPRHQVTQEPFYIYAHEVTSGMYVACVKAGACTPVTKLESGPTSHYGEPAFRDYPVTGVDWLMARDYCAWANGRLPTEAEWELASRSTESLRFPWGAQEPTCDRVNMLGCSVPPDTLKVGSLAKGNSAYDVWDLSGNVWEWVQDWHAKDYYFFSTAINPLGPNISEAKVVRGGGLYSEPKMMRSAARQSADPNRPYDDVGFRCVPMPAVTLPGAYAPVEEVHERVPPDPLEGGGDHVEEPSEPLECGGGPRGDIIVGCPTADGRLSLDQIIHVRRCSDPRFTLKVEGTPFSCVYDTAVGNLHCEGDLPPDYATLPRLAVDTLVWTPGIDGGLSWRRWITLPATCGPGREPPGLFALLTCPVAGTVDIVISSDHDVTYDRVRQNTGSGEVDLSCGPTFESGPTHRTNCAALDVIVDGAYRLHVWGTEAGGSAFEVSDWHVWPARDCPPGGTEPVVTPKCFEDHPSVQVTFDPAAATLETVSVGGTELACIGTAPGVQVCGNLPGAAGSSATVRVCFSGGSCSDYPVTVPGCPVTGSEITAELRLDCNDRYGPVIFFRYTPEDQTVVSASVDGTALRFDEAGGGFPHIAYDLPTFPIPGGTEVDFTFCLSGGGCYTERITIPTCEGETPSGGDWRIHTLGCHDETRIFFTVETGLDWLVPGADFTVRAHDGLTNYACSLVPDIPGRLYCFGPRPGSIPGPLEACIQRAGAASPTCQMWTGWPRNEATIPDCAPEEPPPPPGLPPCSSYTTSGTCPTDRCTWVSQGGGGICFDKP